jgi:hypothetical protein
MAVILSPTGTKGRTESHRRYILCWEWPGMDDGSQGPRVNVVKRSDSKITITKAFDKEHAGRGTVFVWDRVAGRISDRTVHGRTDQPLVKGKVSV